MSLAARCLAVVVLVTLVTAVAAQTPARDRVADKGTSAISGTVVDADTGKPLRRANVYTTLLTPSRSTQTGADGRFVLAELPAGKVGLNATKVGYLAAVGMTSANPRQRVTPFELAAGQTLEKVVIALSRGGVISGRVVDDHGDPLDGAQVKPLRSMYFEGQRRLMQTSGLTIFTDDQGGFRLYGLPPGDVYVSVTPGRDFTPFNAASAEGPVHTFYPGTVNPAEAKPIPVRAGRETSGIVLPVAIARLARVQGRVFSASSEQFLNWNVAVLPIDPQASGMYSFGGGTVRPDGTFEIRNLPPGTYGLEARSQNWPLQSDAESARGMITVSGDDISDVALSATRGGTARGHIVMDDGSTPPFSSNALLLSATPTDAKSPFRGSGRPSIHKDWSFELPGLLGSLRLIGTPLPISSGPPPWAFKGVAHRGRDVTDAGLEFRGGETVDGIDLVFTRKPTRLTGNLDPKANPAATWILAFASDESRWRVPSRYVLGIRPGQDGAYSVPLVPDQEYLILAVDDIEDGQWSDLDLLRTVRDRATRITLADGQTKAHDLTIVNWRR